MNMDRSILATLMLSRCKLARMSREKAIDEADDEWFDNHKWIGSESKGEGSFHWFCDQLDLEPSAVRDAITNG
jgi:hypothetical protein